MDVGAQINQYRVIEHIGRGGMADVWSARDDRLKRTVAIKTIARDLTTDVDPVELFRREAQTIAGLEHPHILPIYDFGEFEGRLYIVMRFVTGGSLERRMRSGPLDGGEIIAVARAVGSALDYAHLSNVVHLDLKPGNILLDSQNSPYLADFGLAAVMGPEGRAENPGSGTLMYMSPEQLTEEHLDFRADIYAFGIFLFHMLTGQLPFNASEPLALRQLHSEEPLPDVREIRPDIPETIIQLLRKLTEIVPERRPDTLAGVVEEFADALHEAGNITTEEFAPLQARTEMLVTMGLTEQAPALASQISLGGANELLEAIDLYFRARMEWAEGKGPFILGVTHFMYINDYYRDAETHSLELDDEGRQVFLRGALEYDVDIDYWWQQVTDDDDRRWVTLHALRSPNAPARLRALRRLETLSDADPPKIPTLVAQALQIENDAEARIAAIQVLNIRAQLRKRRDTFEIPTDVRGKMLSTRLRRAIQLRRESVWQETIYNEEIDTLLAEIALDPDMPRAEEEAARTIGRIHSLTAVRVLEAAYQKGEKGALRALALVRDEAPSLPPDVSHSARLYAWLANTWRRLTDNPIHSVARFLWAAFFAWIALGMHIFVTFRTEQIFNQVRWTNTIAIGLVFGVTVGILALLAGEIPARLRGFWPGWARLGIGLLLGIPWSFIVWGSFGWLLLGNPTPPWQIPAVQLAGTGLTLGFLLAALFNLRGWLAFVIAAVVTWVPLYLMFKGWFDFWSPFNVNLTLIGWAIRITFDQSVLYYDNFNQIYSVAIPLALLIAFGAHLQRLLKDVRVLLRRFI